MITHYLKTFSTLRSDTSRTRWTAATKFRAPHKPLLLLAVIDLIAQGIIKTNFIEFIPDLGELFTLYWSRVMPPDQRSNIILPFYHLNSDKFWHHIPKPGMEAVLAATRQIRGVAQLQEIVLGVKPDDELYSLLCHEESRNLLRTTLPWSLTHNDTIQNGMALCRLCHWTFDEGLITVSGSYAVLVSKQLSANNNIPSHMQALAGRPIIGPAEQTCGLNLTRFTGTSRRSSGNIDVPDCLPIRLICGSIPFLRCQENGRIWF
jgi:predicted restriction endonuclease